MTTEWKPCAARIAGALDAIGWPERRCPPEALAHTLRVDAEVQANVTGRGGVVLYSDVSCHDVEDFPVARNYFHLYAGTEDEAPTGEQDPWPCRHECGLPDVLRNYLARWKPEAE